MASSDKLKEKLGYLSSELEDLKLLRALSPYSQSVSGRNSRSSRHLSHSPRPHKSDVLQPPPPPPPPPAQQFDSRPDIAAWPAPPGPSAVGQSSTSAQPCAAVRQSSLKLPHQQSHQPTTNMSLSISPAPSIQIGSHPHGSPFHSPHPSPVPASPRPSSGYTTYEDSSSKLLSMLKVVAAHSPSVRGRESELREKIQALEETVRDYENQKYSVLGTFSDYREKVAERERHLEAEYSNKIISLSEEVLGAKREFETRMKSFQTLQEKFEREKEQALEKLRQEHQKEIQVLEQRFSESQLLNLEQKYIIEIQRLEEERKSLKAEKDRLGESFEVKLRRAQSLYETELTAAKMLYTRELEALRDHEEALKEELTARQEEFHDRVHEIQNQAKQSKDEMNNCRNEVAQLERKLKQKELEVQNISSELSHARNETNEAIKKLSGTKEESRREYAEQKAELDRKSKLLNEAELTKNKLETTIRDLQTEVKALKNKVDFLEMERDNLQSQSESQTKLHNSQVQALEAVLESVTREKEVAKEHYEKLLEREREQAEEREYSIKKEFSAKLNELEDQYNALREHIEQGDSFGPENVKLWEEIEVLRSEKSVLEEEIGGLRSQLSIGGDHATVQDRDDASLNQIIELLKAIDLVKRRVLRGDSSSSRTTTSSRDSENRDEPTPRPEIQEKGDETKSHQLSETVLDVSVEEIKKELKKRGSGKVEFPTLIKRLKELERSLDVIIREKDDAQAKVEHLGAENKMLMDRLESLSATLAQSQGSHHRHSLATSDGSAHTADNNSEAEQLNKNLEVYRRRIDELESQSRESRKQLEEETKVIRENYAKQLEDQRTTMQNEIDALNEKLKSTSVKSDEDHELPGNEMKSLQAKLEAKEEESEKLRKELAAKTEEMERMAQKMLKHSGKKGAEPMSQKESKKSEQQTEQMAQQMAKPVCAAEGEVTPHAPTNKVRDADGEDDEDEEQSVEDEEMGSTDGASDSRSDAKPSARQMANEENEKLKQKLDSLTQANNEKDELIQRLQRELLQRGNEYQESKIRDDLGRKDRSHSIASSAEHMSMCQKAARLHGSLSVQLSDKKDRIEEMPKLPPTRSYFPKDSDSSKPAISSTSTWMAATRSKSPGLLSRIKDRSPSGGKYYEGRDNTPSASSRHRSLLSPPSDLDSRRRISPSLYYKSSYEKSEKRPAWKF